MREATQDPLEAGTTLQEATAGGAGADEPTPMPAEDADASREGGFKPIFSQAGAPAPGSAPGTDPAPLPEHAAGHRLGLWKMSLLLTGSAFCGGIAVVLWNRRLLTKMREVAPVARPERQGRLWEDDL